MRDRRNLTVTVMTFVIQLAAITVFSCLHSTTYSRSLSECRTGYIEWIGKPVREITEASHTIALVNVVGFVQDSQPDGEDGYYILSDIIVLKGDPKNNNKIYGFRPFDQIPQEYFNTERNHNRIDRQGAYHGNAWLIEKGSKCRPVPKFVIGYNYLILLGTESKMSFEPIHSVIHDKWYLDVEKSLK